MADDMNELENEFRELGMESGADSEAEGSSTKGRNGGYRYPDQDEMKKQRRAMFAFVKQVGSNVFRGQDLVNISLPVTLFTPRSFLERLTDNWTTLPHYLPKAAGEKDPVKRLTNVVAFIVSGLKTTVESKKPFNPIWGETYQAEYEDGSQVFCEQTSHHPPVSNWEIVGPENSFNFSGHGNWSGSLRGNALKGQLHGPNRIRFADGTVITWELPYLMLRGLLWGERVMDYCGKITVRDDMNRIYCDLVFDPDRQGWFKSLFAKRQSPTDTFRGEIYTEHGTNKVVYADVEGSWLSHMDVTPKHAKKAERIWDGSSMQPAHPNPVKNPIPSDSRFREDLVHLRDGKVEVSQEWKVKLEEKQRNDRKLRKAAAAAAK